MGARMKIEEIEDLGFEVERVSCYDEEGVEGWKLTGPTGVEKTELGLWDEDPPFDKEDLEEVRG
jgi:hypothetical protein